MTVRNWVWVGIFGVTERWLDAKSNLFKFEELAKGTIGWSTPSAIMYRLEIWLNEKQELFLTSRMRALSKGCVRRKTREHGNCTRRKISLYCLRNRSPVRQQDTGYVRQNTPGTQLWNKDHKKSGWKRTLKELTTEETARDVNPRDAFSKSAWWQRTCIQASHAELPSA